MPYPHYTAKENQKALKAAVDSGKAALMHFDYWMDAYQPFMEAYPFMGKMGYDSPEPFEMIISGKLRNGNGEKFPPGWGGKELCTYIYEKETERKNQAKGPDEAKPAPDFLLYDEEKKCFIELTTENFFSKGTTSLKEGERINIGSELIADEDPQKTARANEIKGWIEQGVVADAAAAVTELISDLRKRDSIFSSDSKEYKDFYNGLKQLRNQLVDENDQPRHFDSLDQLKALFNDPNNDVYKMAGDYLSKKMTQKDKLSDRQIDRMSMCRRFRSIDQAVGKAVDDAKAGKFPDCQNAIINATASHKAVLGIVKNAGAGAAARVFGSSAVYQDQFNRAKEIFTNDKKPFRAARLAKKNIDIVSDYLLTGKKYTEKFYNEEDYREQVKRLAEEGPNKTKMAVIAEFMLKRTHGMLEELKANDSFTHSNEQKEFRKSVEKLHDELIGTFENNNALNKFNLFKKIKDVDKLAEAYQMRHIGDTAGKGDMKAAHRLGVAAEIRIMRDYIENLDENNVNPSDLFKRVKAHQDLMRELDVRHNRYVNESINHNFISSNPLESAEYKKAAGAYTRAFNRLINASGYGKVVDERVSKNEEFLKNEDEATLAIAVTQNKSLKAVKKEMAEKSLIAPDNAAPEIANPENGPKEIGGMEEQLLK